MTLLDVLLHKQCSLQATVYTMHAFLYTYSQRYYYITMHSTQYSIYCMYVPNSMHIIRKQCISTLKRKQCAQRLDF